MSEDESHIFSGSFSVGGESGNGGVHFGGNSHVQIKGKIVQGDQEKVVFKLNNSQPIEEDDNDDNVNTKVINGSVSGGRRPVIFKGSVNVKGNVVGGEINEDNL